MKKPRRRTVVFSVVAVLIAAIGWALSAPRNRQEQHRIRAKLQELRLDWVCRNSWGIQFLDRYFLKQLIQYPRLYEIRIDLGRNFDSSTVVQLSYSTVRARDLDAAVAWAQRFPNLESLSLSHSQITNAHLRKLGTLPQLRSLSLRNSEVSDEGLAHLAGFAALEKLELTDTNVSHVGLTHLAELQTLTHLQLTGCRISGPGIVELRKLPRLQSLVLSRSDVGDDDLERLQGIAQLTELSLEDTNVTDCGLVHLTGLPALAHVDLSGTNVTGSGLPPLASVRALRSITLARTKAVPSIVNEAAKALPHVDIFTDTALHRGASLKISTTP
jgi:uncharacterized protein YjbI with pentapeptide repeats